MNDAGAAMVDALRKPRKETDYIRIDVVKPMVAQAQMKVVCKREVGRLREKRVEECFAWKASVLED